MTKRRGSGAGVITRRESLEHDTANDSSTAAANAKHGGQRHAVWHVQVHGRPACIVVDPRGCTEAEIRHNLELRFPGLAVELVEAADG
jgi:hypothetical protein